MYSILHELYPRFSNSQTFASRAICTCTSECPCAKRVRNRHRTPSRRIDRLRSKGREMSAKMRDFQRPCFKFFFFSFLLFFPFFFFVDPSSLGFVCDDRFPSVRNIQYTYTYTRSDTVQREGKRTRTRGESIMRDVALFFSRGVDTSRILYSTPLHSTPKKKRRRTRSCSFPPEYQISIARSLFAVQ